MNGHQWGGDYVQYKVFGPINSLGLFNYNGFTFSANGVEDFLSMWKETNPPTGKYIVTSNFCGGVAREYEVTNEPRLELVKA